MTFYVVLKNISHSNRFYEVVGWVKRGKKSVSFDLRTETTIFPEVLCVGLAKRSENIIYKTHTSVCKDL